MDTFDPRPDIHSHLIFLSDYDILAEHLVQGVDVWINTPRRPWEASGTSGMKVLVNGGINLSELDGWWAEAYTPQLGWALGDGQEHGDDPAWDAAEADALYDLLEHEVIPEFYTRDEQGIPVAWVARMRESMAHLTPTFSANRTVREYTGSITFRLPPRIEHAQRTKARSAGRWLIGRTQHPARWILGIPIGLDYSWFLIFALLTWTLAASYYPAEFKNWSAPLYWFMGAVTAIMLFASVLLHELGALRGGDTLQNSGAQHHALYLRWGRPDRGGTA